MTTKENIARLENELARNYVIFYQLSEEKRMIEQCQIRTDKPYAENVAKINELTRSIERCRMEIELIKDALRVEQEEERLRQCEEAAFNPTLYFDIDNTDGAFVMYSAIGDCSELYYRLSIGADAIRQPIRRAKIQYDDNQNTFFEDCRGRKHYFSEATHISI